jgi:hypothetical protein
LACAGGEVDVEVAPFEPVCAAKSAMSHAIDDRCVPAQLPGHGRARLHHTELRDRDGVRLARMVASCEAAAAAVGWAGELLALSDWRRCVAELYREVRAASDPLEAWRVWRAGREGVSGSLCRQGLT